LSCSILQCIAGYRQTYSKDKHAYHIYIHVCSYTYIYIYVYVYVYVSIYTYVYINDWFWICLTEVGANHDFRSILHCVIIKTKTYIIHMYTCIYVYIYVYVYAYEYIYTYIYTYTCMIEFDWIRPNYFFRSIVKCVITKTNKDKYIFAP